MQQISANKTPPCIGVLGCGYVGQQLLLTQQWHPSSWYNVHQNDPQLHYPSVLFSLDDPDSWDALPQQADCLVLTIAPAYQDAVKESQRLTSWCEWMQVNRPGLKRLIYISTIGVYAEQAGTWTEQSPCEPTSLRGLLRLESETVLQRYFKTTSIRCGGIYGPTRNIMAKLAAGKAVFRGNKPVYRIHIDDLVGIISALINDVNCDVQSLNAVDDRAMSQDEIIEALSQQPAVKQMLSQAKFQQKRLDIDEGGVSGQRVVSNRALLATLGFRLQHPVYRLLTLAFN